MEVFSSCFACDHRKIININSANMFEEKKIFFLKTHQGKSVYTDYSRNNSIKTARSSNAKSKFT